MCLGMLLYIMGAGLLLPSMQRRARERNMRHVVLTPMFFVLFGFWTFIVFGYWADHKLSSFFPNRRHRLKAKRRIRDALDDLAQHFEIAS